MLPGAEKLLHKREPGSLRKIRSTKTRGRGRQRTGRWIGKGPDSRWAEGCGKSLPTNTATSPETVQGCTFRLRRSLQNPAHRGPCPPQAAHQNQPRRPEAVQRLLQVPQGKTVFRFQPQLHPPCGKMGAACGESLSVLTRAPCTPSSAQPHTDCRPGSGEPPQQGIWGPALHAPGDPAKDRRAVHQHQRGRQQNLRPKSHQKWSR